ncbi:hypothetical protein ES708_20911 [subsurface metagenome]
MNKRHKKQKADWDKEELTHLYWAEDKTLQQIGNLFGVTRERVKQVMERFSIPRKKTWARQQHRPHTPHFTSLSDYLARGKDSNITMRRFLPKNISCAECGSREHFHIHHINYPARFLSDIQILCPACHRLKHKYGLTYVQQIDIYKSYTSGVPTKQLSEQYHCSRINIYKIISKIKNGYRSQRGGHP